MVISSAKWSRDKRSTLAGATPQNTSDQLWACCETELETAVYNTGVRSDDDESKLLGAMKKLTVIKQNSLINVVEFLDMAQDPEETGGPFVARLKGKCSSDSCAQVTNYTDQMVCHQLVRGLADLAIQEQVLAHGADNADLDLAKTLKFVESKEAEKRSSNLLSTTRGLNRMMNDFQNSKSRSKAEVTPSTTTPVDKRKCGCCGPTGHGKRPPASVRREKFNALNHTCEKCSSIGHYGSVCRSRKKP